MTMSLAGALRAATPASGTINTPSDNTFGTKQTITYSGGPLYASTGLDAIVTNTSIDLCTASTPPPTGCDFFNLNVNLPSDYSSTHFDRVFIHLTWTAAAGTDPANNDLDLYLLDANDNLIASSNSTNPAAAGGSGRAEESIAMFNVMPGSYRVLVTTSTSTSPTPLYNVTINFDLVQPPDAPPQSANIFQNFVPPLPAPGDTRLGTGEGEPSIGVNQKTGNAMVQSGFDTLRISFDDSVYPSTSNWASVGALITSVVSADPILWMDPRTNRTFVSQLLTACSLMAYSDDDGASWFQNPIGCGLFTGIDHQTVGGGPFAPPLTSTDVAGHYPNSVVYCAQASVAAECAMSTNGGILFGAGFPTYTTLDCGGLHGHLRVGPEGNLYLPNGRCNGQQGMAVSKDNGVTWAVKRVPGSTVHSNGGDSDPWIDVAADGTVYYGYADGDGHARIAVTQDAGDTWSQPFDAGASQGVVNTEFPAVVVGDNNRAAYAFLGSNTAGNSQSSTFPGDWYLFVAFTYDGGQSWTTYNATPDDPVQRGCIWNQGGGNPCRNLLDFNGIALDAQGRVVVVYTDGCIDDPLDPAVRCVSQHTFTKSVLTTVARQSGGIGLRAAWDGQIFKTVPGAPTLTGLAGNNVNHLSWTDGSNGNSPITNHKIYRGTASNAETLLATVGAVPSYDDTGVSNGTAYFYRVSASNAVGDSPTSNEITLTPRFTAAPSAPQRLKATGKKAGILLTWSPPKDSGTAPVTNYRVYRSTAPGLETLLTTVGNTTNFIDGNVASGTTYYYKVSAVNSVGEGPRSNEDSARPK